MYNIGDVFSTPYPNRHIKIIDRDLSGVYQYKIEYEDDRTIQVVGDCFLNECLQLGYQMNKLEIGTKLNKLGTTGYITSIDETRPDGHYYGVLWEDEHDIIWHTRQKVVNLITDHSVYYAAVHGSVKQKVGSLKYKFWACYSDPFGFEVFADCKSCERRVKELAKQDVPAVMLETTKACLPKDIERVETEDIPF